MNERFKFRAWLKDAKVMVDVEQIDFYNNTIAYIFDNYAEVEQEWIDNDIHNVELIQFTGLKDKNGVEIYEGDIVDYFRNELAVIVYRAGGVDIRSRTWEQSEPIQRRLGEIEVIGNIYENPELLEASK